MVFTTHLFVFYFLPAVLLLYYLLPFRWRTGLLALCSYAFYGWANPWWAVLMFLSSGVDYVCGLVLARLSGLPRQADGDYAILTPEERRTRGMKHALWLSILFNMLLLAYLKYIGFSVANIEHLVDLLTIDDN